MPSSSLGVLAPDAHTPVVADTTVGADLLHPLKIIAQLGGNVLRKSLRGLSRLPVSLPVEEPVGYLELPGVLDYGDLR
jgi:hypothetical protein